MRLPYRNASTKIELKEDRGTYFESVDYYCYTPHAEQLFILVLFFLFVTSSLRQAVSGRHNLSAYL